MTHRRAPSKSSSTSSSSSTDFEDRIPLMVHRSSPLYNQSSFALLQMIPLNRLYYNNKRWALACITISAVVVMLITLGAPSYVDTHNRRKSNHLNTDAQSKEILDALYDLPIPTTEEELNELNEELMHLDPPLILQWAHHHLVPTTSNQYPLVQVTSFGPSGLVILHLLSELHLFKDVPVITMDTLHLFPESYAFYKTIQLYYTSKSNHMNLLITKPAIESREEFDKEYGSTLWKNDVKKLTKLTKIDPLNKVLDKYQTKMWITGRRRSSGGERSTMDVLEFEYFDNDDNEDEDIDKSDYPFDTRRGRWKLNPLTYWTYNQVWEYIRKHKLPYNVLYDKGYTSLGDEMTTGLPQLNATSISRDEFERSGRFIGMKNKECGLHTHRQKIKAKKQRAEENGEEFTVPTLVCDKCIDLNVDNFEAEIKSGEKDLLLEFFSPYCGSCQEFAPTLNRIANHLSFDFPSVRGVARFDITENDAPQIDGKDEFTVEATPTLYRVRYVPIFQVELYDGNHDFESIVGWMTSEIN